MSDEIQKKVVEEYCPDFAFAYGSGAFHQKGHMGTKQIDFIFGVENPLEWHLRNIEYHPKDYSLFGKALLKKHNWFDRIQNTGAGIWYHTYVPFESEDIKYGVVSLDNLRSDLEKWETLYFAGRMHKPVNIIINDNKISEKIIENNRRMALHVALMTLPNNFSQVELYKKIASISYTGDSRMAVGENPNKVGNIVLGNMIEFEKIYQPLFTETGVVETGENLFQTCSHQDLYDILPDSIKQGRSNLEFFSDPDYPRLLHESICQIVNQPTKKQTIKGIITAGISDSVKYGSSKIMKRIKKQ